MKMAQNRLGLQKLEIPKFSDVRWVLLFFLVIYSITLILNPSFGKSFLHLVLAFSVTSLTDIIANYITRKKIIFPLSSMTTSIGIVLIVFSAEIWPFFIIPFISILSKYLIKIDQKHIFNPNNFGMSFAFLFLGGYVSTTSGRWGGSLLLYASIIIFGFLISYKAKRLRVSLIYILSFILFSLLRGYFQDAFDLFQNLFPLTSPLFYLFSFYHITDPSTGPKSNRGQFLFAISIAFVDNFLRFFEIQYSPFYSLFIVTLILPFISMYFKQENYLYAKNECE